MAGINDAAEHNMLKLKGLSLGLLSLFVLGVIIVSVLWLTIDSKWVENKIIEVVKTKMNAEITFESFELEKSSGSISMEEVSFVNKMPKLDINASFDKAYIDISVLHLVFR